MNSGVTERGSIELVPSSARSASSAASPLPSQLVPLLSPVLEVAKEVVGRVMPVSKKRTALEEAEWEDDVGEEGAFDREMMLQSQCSWFNFILLVADAFPYSDGETTSISPSSCTLRISWDGTNFCRCCYPPSSGGISRSDARP
jgi:hypothetical protein